MGSPTRTSTSEHPDIDNVTEDRLFLQHLPRLLRSFMHWLVVGADESLDWWIAV